MDPLAALAPSVLPPEVRAGTDQDKQAYRAALGFEQVLLGQLLREVDGLSPEGAPAAYGELVPQTLADALAAGGGVGLARELYPSLRERSR